MRTDDDPDWAVRKALLVDVYIVYMVFYMSILPNISCGLSFKP